MLTQLRKDQNTLQIGDVVYILGKYTISAYAPVWLIEARISHIRRRQFVAYEAGKDGEYSGREWRFSSKNLGLSVFTDKAEAFAAHARMRHKNSNTYQHD